MHNRRRLLLSGYEVLAKGVYGPTSEWTLRKNGTFIISGTGAPYSASLRDSWTEYKSYIKNVVIQEGITVLADTAFSYCENLETVSFPETLTTIQNNAFSDSNLTSFDFIPESVTTIGANAFSNTLITEITFPAGVTSIGGQICDGCTMLTSVTIEGNVTTIGGYAFRNTAVTEIALPSSVTSLGANWISGSAKNIYYAGTFEQWLGITRADSGGYNLYCQGVLQEDVSTGIAVIPAYAFAHMNQLKSVRFTNASVSLPSTSTYVFSGSSIKDVVFPATITVLPVRTFRNVTSKPDVVFEGDISAIGDFVFWNDLIGSLSFANNTGIPTLGSSAISGMKVDHIYVPAALETAWKAAPDWAAFANVIEAV